METSVPDIYAVGDAVQITNTVTGEGALISLAAPANKQARIAADNICGRESRYRGAQGGTVVKLFDLTAAAAGISEAAAKRAGTAADKIILSPMSHAGYYPGGKVMTMKVLFDKKTYKLLGAQIIGYDGVDKRIDVIATAIYARMKAYELKDIDLAYAPPYSSAKDPVNMAGYMIDNIKEGVMKQFYIEDIEGLQRNDNVTLLDTRTVREYSKGHIDGFMNIPVDELRERYKEIPLDKTVYVMCQSGLRSYISARILEGYGFACYNFTGGYRYYDVIKCEYSQSSESTACGIDI
jgi:rhodanese-related sulfurtransferase